MHYIPSKKNNSRSKDREVVDVAVEALATDAVKHITNNLSVILVYACIFEEVSYLVKTLLERSATKKFRSFSRKTPSRELAYVIYQMGKTHGYEGAFLGEFNYAITRFIQRVPQIKVANGYWDEEFRYWYYAATIEALQKGRRFTQDMNIGLSGVFEDVKDEYKRRVNTAYEAEQIIKSGDCYDTPYYTKLVGVIGYNGKHVGYQEILLKRSDETLDEDSLEGHFILHAGYSK